MKGSEIIERWQKASKAVCAKGRRLGEVGGMLRGMGYDIYYDGFNTCTFAEKGLEISYNGNDYDKPWHAEPVVRLSGEKYYIPVGEKKTYLRYIDPDKTYDVEQRISKAEAFERGLVKYESFVVCSESNRAISDKWYFDTFEEADKCAREVCQERIERRFSDRECRPYFNTSVCNDAQRALENGELRHYQWYNYDGHRCWINVRGTNE